MSQMQSSNPFIYGRPLQPHEFINRELEIRTVFNRLRNGESSAIIGEPHIGKTSLLLKLADKTTQQDYLGEDALRTNFSYVNLHPIDEDFCIATFWKDVLAPLKKHPGHPSTAKLLEVSSENNHDNGSLYKLATHLQERNIHFVVFLDEIERLIFHKNFQQYHFWAGFRQLASLISFDFVITSRITLEYLNIHCNSLASAGAGSDIFNTFTQEKLKPFDEKSVHKILDLANNTFNLKDRTYILRVAGHHPYLVQGMAACLFETTGNLQSKVITTRFYGRISHHFDDLWRTLDDESRTVAVILSLMELGGSATGRRFQIREIGNVARFSQELSNLAYLGLAERVSEKSSFDWQHLLLWRGERWRIKSEAFTWWVRDVVVSKSREVPAYDEWLQNKRYRLFVTDKGWAALAHRIHKSPKWIGWGIGAVIRGLIDGILKRLP